MRGPAHTIDRDIRTDHMIRLFVKQQCAEDLITIGSSAVGTQSMVHSRVSQEQLQAFSFDTRLQSCHHEGVSMTAYGAISGHGAIQYRKPQDGQKSTIMQNWDLS